MKQGWKIINSNGLWARWMRQRYIKNFWQMTVDNNASSTWKTTMKIRDKLAANCSREIATGREIDL